MRRLLAAVATTTVTVVMLARPAGAGLALSCIGDCDANGIVAVNELVTGVGIVLERIGIEQCRRLERPTVDGLVAGVNNALRGCANVRTRAFEHFERFDFLRSAAFGFCPVYGSVLAATLLRQENGRYLLKTTIAERGVEGVDRCLIPGRFGGDCTLGRVQGCRVLSEEESAQVAQAVSVLRVWPTEAPDCGVIDPCLHVSLDWDDTRLSDDPCSSDRPLATEIDRMAAVLDQLSTASMGECPPGTCELGDVFLCNDGNDVGGDGCAPNCTDETTVECDVAEPSELALQSQNAIVRFALRGRQTLRLGARSFDNVIPVAVRSSEFHVQPMPLAGVGCLCLYGDPLPALGDGLTGFGLASCSSFFGSTDVISVADRDTTPGSPGNDGGLPDDPECDDVAPILDAIVSRACREGVDPDCGSEITGRCRSPRQIVRETGEGAAGVAVVAYNLRLELLRDAGMCSTLGLSQNGACAVPDYGPDCIACTTDDVGTATAALTLATTDQAEAALFDAGTIAQTSDIARTRDCGAERCQTMVDGERFDCDLLESNLRSGWATGSLAGAWPEIATPEIGDNVATVRIRCE